jgi:hypothetical protein
MEAIMTHPALGFEQTMSLLNRIGNTPFLIKTTHPSDDSGVALLSRHFAERDTIDERQALALRHRSIVRTGL